jgi:hypothetical protein
MEILGGWIPETLCGIFESDVYDRNIAQKALIRASLGYVAASDAYSPRNKARQLNFGWDMSF